MALAKSLIIAAFLLFVFPSPSEAQQRGGEASLRVDRYELVSRRRVGSLKTEYEFAVTVVNIGKLDAPAATLRVTSDNPAVSVLDGEAAIPLTPARGRSTSTDTIVVQVDRTRPINLQDLHATIAISSLAPPASPRRFRAELAVLPAETVVVPLRELDLTDLPDDVVVHDEPGLSAGWPEAVISGDDLVVATPGDVGRDQRFILDLRREARAVGEIVIDVPTTRPVDVFAFFEGEGEAPPPLTIRGLDENNVLTGDVLAISVEGLHEINPDVSDIFLVHDDGRIGRSLDDYFTYDPATGTASASGERLAALKDALPRGVVQIGISIVSEDFEISGIYDVLVLNGARALSGRLVSQEPLDAEAADLAVAIVGRGSDLRRVAPLDADASFSFQGLVPDTYELTVVDLYQPNAYLATVEIASDAAGNEVLIPYEPPASAAPTRRAPEPTDVAPPPPGEETERRGELRAPQRSPLADFSLQASGEGCRAINNSVTLEVPVGRDDPPIQASCLFSGSYVPATDPNGPTSFTFRVQPTDSLDPDFGSYSFSATVGGRSISGSGPFSNDRYEMQETACVTFLRDEAGLPSKPVIDVSGSLSIQVNPNRTEWTTVPASISFTMSDGHIGGGFSGEECPSLTFTARIRERNARGHRVIAPVVVGLGRNRDGRFVSLPAAAATDFGFRVEIDYVGAKVGSDTVPAAVAITDLDLFVNDFEIPNALGLATRTNGGRIVIPDLIIPPIPGLTPSRTLTFIRARITGDVDGQPVRSPLWFVEFEPPLGSKNAGGFTALYLAEETIPAPGRRYGQQIGHEPGDDNWATVETIEWLSERNWLFNDISALHVAQTPAGRSILDHDNHSDGSTIDLRYLDPDGQFTDFGRAGAVAELVDDAMRERGQGGGRTVLQQRLVNWIRHNRRAIETEAAGVRRIIVAGGRVGQALSVGRYPDPDGSVIVDPAANPPGPIGRWTRPRNVFIDRREGHIDHWHIELY